MHRLARHTLTFCSAVSLLLFVAVCALWVRSYFRWDTLMRADISPRGAEWHYLLWGVRTADGVVKLSFDAKHFDSRLPDNRFQQPPGRWFPKTSPRPAAAPHQGAFGRFSYTTKPYPGVRSLGDVKMVSWQLTDMAFPFWPVALAFGAGGLPVPLLVRRRLRPKPGVCRKCGYDLRASPDRCPECGTPSK